MPSHRTLLVVVSLALLGVGTVVVYRSNHISIGTNTSTNAAVHPSVGPIRNVITGKGTVAFVHQVIVKAQRAGRVDQVWVHEGEQIRRGQPLVHTADIESDVELATRNAERQKVQARIAVLKQDEADTSRLVTAGAAAPYELKQKSLELELALKDLEISSHDRERSEINKAKATVRSPFDGMVVTRPVAMGQWVAQGDELLTVAGGSARSIVASVDATDIAHIYVGQKVVFSEQPDSGTPLTGRVASISRVVDSTQRQNAVRVIVESATDIGYLRLSQQLYIEFVIRDVASVLRIPKDFVHTTERGRVVYVDDGYAISPRRVETIAGDRYFDEVVSGLESKDRIVRKA